MCYTGSQANVSVYSQEHHHAAKWRSLLQPLQDRKEGRKAWSWRACCAEKARPHPPRSPSALGAWLRDAPSECLGRATSRKVVPLLPLAPRRRCRREGLCQPLLVFSRLNLSVGKPGVITARLWRRTALAAALRAELSQPSWWSYGRP